MGPQPGGTAHPPGPRARTAPSMQGTRDGGWQECSERLVRKWGDHGLSLQQVPPGPSSSRTGSTTGHLGGRKREPALSIQNPPEPEWGRSAGSPRTVPSLTEGQQGSREAQDSLGAS